MSQTHTTFWFAQRATRRGQPIMSVAVAAALMVHAMVLVGCDGQPQGTIAGADSRGNNREVAGGNGSQPISGESPKDDRRGAVGGDANLSLLKGGPLVDKDKLKEITGVNCDNIVTTESGLQYVDFQDGSGQPAKAGQNVRVHYTGWLTNGKKFDSSRDRGDPIEFPLGQGRVIKGWDEGVEGLKPGQGRVLIIPPALGYGDRGVGGGLIPSKSVLVFKVELVSAK